ncbi:uncharacterized protein LOC144167685 [Haemaphysalis longicornis]
MPRATSYGKHTVLLVVVLALFVGNVQGWATLKKILMARLLSGPRVIAVPVPVPSGHHHHHSPPPHPPHHHHHHLPPPPPPPPLLPVPVPVHHYHYPPTNVWEAPLPKSPGVTEVTDLSHLHALFDAPAETPTKANHHHIDVIDYSAAAEALSSASSNKPSKASPTQSLPTYSERTATKRPAYNPYRSATYYSAETPGRYYSPPAVSAHEDKSYATIDYDSYASKALTTAARKPYGPRYLEAADHPAYMAALKQYMKEKHISSLESAWSRMPASHQTEPAKWPADDSSSAYKAADYSSQYKNYGWAPYPASSYGKEEHRDTSKQYASPDSYDWARYVASAYKAAAEKASSQSPAAARYDTEAHNADAYAALSSTTTEPTPSSEKYEADEKDEGLSTLASATATTSKTATDLVAPDPPPATTASSEGVTLTKKD